MAHPCKKFEYVLQRLGTSKQRCNLLLHPHKPNSRLPAAGIYMPSCFGAIMSFPTISSQGRLSTSFRVGTSTHGCSVAISRSTCRNPGNTYRY